jgi:hypothetical protein
MIAEHYQEITQEHPRVGGEHSSKEPFEQLVNSYSGHLHKLATVYYFLSIEQCYVHA